MAQDHRQAQSPTIAPETNPQALVHLLGGPYVTYGDERRLVPEGSKRLLAFVALRRGRVERLYAAGALWPFGDDLRAAGNLRSALWRLRRAGVDVIDADKWSLALTPGTVVDVHQLAGWATRLIQRSAEAEDLTLRQLPEDACHLLPGWYDEWVVLERERIRQRVLHGLEALAEQLTEQARYADAVEAAILAVANEPLRESAQRALLSVYLAQGNLAEAQCAYATFAHMLRRELGVEPSRQIAHLIRCHDPESGATASGSLGSAGRSKTPREQPRPFGDRSLGLHESGQSLRGSSPSSALSSRR
jgi:DNA-binding SARP family transcriptional activator